MPKGRAALKSKITKLLKSALKISAADAGKLIPSSLSAGKLYEAYSLGLLCQELKYKEGCTCTLINGTKIVLKSSGGPINLSYPYIRVTRNGKHFANIWTDIYFTSLSYVHTGSGPPKLGDYHELDIAVVQPNAAPRPLPEEILIAVECKNTGYQKHLLREILGVRRELSFLHSSLSTGFATWPAAAVPALPPSCLVVYSTDPHMMSYSSPGVFFGIEFIHASM